MDGRLRPHPRINQNAGRDHYPRAWSVVLGGGNVKGGYAHGATDKGLGIDPTPETNASVRDNLGRPRYAAAA